MENACQTIYSQERFIIFWRIPLNMKILSIKIETRVEDTEQDLLAQLLIKNNL